MGWTTRALGPLYGWAYLLGAVGCSGGPLENVGETDEALIRTCEDGDVVQGIDVSKYQGAIDWAAVKASGVTFAFARTNDGSYVDPEFATNWANMKNAGLIRGPYQFFRNTRSGAEQAEIMLKLTGPLNDDDLPPVLDVENASLSDATSLLETQQIIGSWVSYIKEHTGRMPIVYTGPYFWRDQLNSFDMPGVPLWIAHYTNDKYCPLLPDPWKKWTFHQWGVTAKGSVAGIQASIDRDVFNGTADQLRAFVADSHLVTKPTPLAPQPTRPEGGGKPRPAEAASSTDAPAPPEGGGCSIGRETPGLASRSAWYLVAFLALTPWARKRNRKPASFRSLEV